MSNATSGMTKKAVRAAMMVLALGGAGVVLAGCQSDKDIDITKLMPETDAPDALYNQGLANIKAGKLQEASRKFDAIDKQYPFTEWSRKALVMSTFTKYRLGRSEDAVAAGTRYMAQYPHSQDSAYVQYLIGLAHSRQISAVTQDQSAARKTIEAMQKVVTNFPDSEYVDDAQTKIRFARDQLAGKEMQIGRYYLERKEYLAAVSRFRVVVEQFGNTNQVEEALARLTEAYYAMGLTEEAQTAAAVLGRNYPDSQWYADSYKLLKSGGHEPRENSGSWISRAGKKLIGA